MVRGMQRTKRPRILRRRPTASPEVRREDIHVLPRERSGLVDAIESLNETVSWGSTTPCGSLVLLYNITCPGSPEEKTQMISEIGSSRLMTHGSWKPRTHIQKPNSSIPFPSSLLLHRHGGRVRPHRARRPPNLHNLPPRGQRHGRHLVHRALLRVEHAHHLNVP